MTARIDKSAIVSEQATIGDSVQIWNFSQIREDSVIGASTIVGSHVYIDRGVRVGDNCKIQNGAKIYEPAILGDGVFIGPGVILTNDQYPRAVNSDLNLKLSTDWVQSGVNVGAGASVGAGSVCIAPVNIGNWALIGAGSVVTKDVLEFELVVGNPAKHAGWVGHEGLKLARISDQSFQCPKSKRIYSLIDGELKYGGAN